MRERAAGKELTETEEGVTNSEGLGRLHRGGDLWSVPWKMLKSLAGGITGNRGFQKLGVNFLFIYLLVLLLIIKVLKIHLENMEYTKKL